MKKKMILHGLDAFQSKNQISALIHREELDRKKIAKELHNDISSKLNVISLNCHLLKIPDLPQKDKEEITNNIIEFTAKALNSAQKMTYSLLPPVLEKFGLHAGIEELCDRIEDSVTVDIQYRNNVKFDFKDNERHIHIFRILQELLANSIQHGKATSIFITFNEEEEKKTCNYSDNGIGFDLGQLESHNGLGMKNIQSRIAILEGEFSIESQMDNGVSVFFKF